MGEMETGIFANTEWTLTAICRILTSCSIWRIGCTAEMSSLWSVKTMDHSIWSTQVVIMIHFYNYSTLNSCSYRVAIPFIVQDMPFV